MLDEQMKKCFAVAPRSASWSLEGGTAISPVVWGSPGLSSRPLPRSKGTMARAVRSYISMEYLRQGRTSLHTNNICCLGRVFYIVQRGKEWHFLIKSQLCCNRLVLFGLVWSVAVWSGPEMRIVGFKRIELEWWLCDMAFVSPVICEHAPTICPRPYYDALVFFPWWTTLNYPLGVFCWELEERNIDRSCFFFSYVRTLFAGGAG